MANSYKMSSHLTGYKSDRFTDSALPHDEVYGMSNLDPKYTANMDNYRTSQYNRRDQYTEPRSSDRYGYLQRSNGEGVTRSGYARNGTGVDTDSDLASHQEYPKHKPFINDDYRPDPNKPVKALPESNRQAVMSALKGLQDKIRQLEVERTAAEQNLRSLASETSKFRDILNTDADASYISQASLATNPANLTQQNQDVHSKLETAEHRCDLLERQLDHMRKMVQTAEEDRNHAMQRATRINQQQQESEEYDIRHRLDKIAELEREHLKMMATQTMAETKIRDLEGKLKEEQHHREYIQSKAAELETAAETNRILLAANSPLFNNQAARKSKRRRKKSGKVSTKKSTPTTPRGYKQRSGYEPTEHYKLNLAEIPFVAGKSTTPSHSLPANFQEVLSLMKSHNPKLCKSPRQHVRSGYGYLNTQGSSSSSGFGGSSSEGSDMADLLLQLQDEFGRMSFEHQELSTQIAQASEDPRLREDLERELDVLVARMEAKGEQITRLHRHQQSRSATKKKKRPKSTTSTAIVARRPQVVSTETSEVDGEVEVTTTIRTKGKGASMVKGGAGSNRAQASLNLYKDLKKIQTTLRKDDLSWDDC